MSIEVMNWAWEQPVAKATNKLVLLALADHANADGECWPSMKRIAERSDISPRHVSRAINELIDLGLVEKAGLRTFPTGRERRVEQDVSGLPWPGRS